MGIARKVGQQRGHLRVGGAVGHASGVGGVGAGGFSAPFPARPQGMVGLHAQAVGHALLHLGDVLVRQHKVLGHHLGQVEHESHHRIHLVGLERLGRVPGHGAVDVVPQGGQGGQLHHGGAAGVVVAGQIGHPTPRHIFRGDTAHHRIEHLVGLAKHPMARGALGLPHVLALGHRTRTFGQAFEIGTHIDVPSGNFARRGRAAQTGIGRSALRPGVHRQVQRANQRSGGSFKPLGHFSPRRFLAPTTIEWRCCDKWIGCRAPCAVGHRWAGQNRCRRWPGFG